MNIPKNVLVALNDLVAMPPARGQPTTSFNRFEYFASNGSWTGVIRVSSTDAWVVFPLVGINGTGPDVPIDALESCRDWLPNLALTQGFRESLPSHIPEQEWDFLYSESYVAQRSTNEFALCIRSHPCLLVAALLNDAGDPPNPISQDWKNQIDRIDPTCSFITPAETFTTEEGILLPFSDSIQSWAASISLTRQLTAVPDQAAIHDIRWPWQSTSPAPSDLAYPAIKSRVEPELPWTASIRTDSFSSKHGKLASQKRASSPRLTQHPLLMAITLATVLILASVAWTTFSKPTHEKLSSKPSRSSGTETSLQNSVDTLQQPSNPSELGSEVTESETIAGVQELSILPGISDFTQAPAESHESQTIDTLLSQLNPKQSGVYHLSSMTPATIIADALSVGSSSTLEEPATEMPADPSLANTGQLSDAILAASDAKSDESSINPNLDNEVDRPLEHTFRVDTASHKNQFSIGRRVQARAYICQLALSLSEGLVVEPSESIAIDGTNKASWKIAIEDEEPELMLVITSKPGSRWQLIANLGVRENSTSIPVLLGPNDAQNVNNRLVDYYRWLTNSIATLEIAKANLRTKSRVDYFGEIKKLEGQQRDVERAIQRWKAISKLSHSFYESNKISVKLILPANP